MEQNKPLVVCSGLTKSYGSFTALKNLDLNLERGRFIGLLGPNGSGKTTTIKLLNGLLQPTSGTITVDGAQPGCYTHSIVSYLPDRAYLSDWMKVTDVIDFFSDFYRDFDRVKAIEMFKALRISPLDRLKTLSKGTKEKVQLILTMSRRAQLYVLDEPLYSNNWHKLMEQREEIVFVASASLSGELSGRELTIEELLEQPFFLTEQDNYRRVLNRRLAARRTILTPSLECGDTSLLIRMLEVDRGVSFLPWYAVESGVQQGRLIRLSVEDCYISLYRQIFCHKEKWRTREMDEFVRVAKLADE